MSSSNNLCINEKNKIYNILVLIICKFKKLSKIAIILKPLVIIRVTVLGENLLPIGSFRKRFQ